MPKGVLQGLIALGVGFALLPISLVLGWSGKPALVNMSSLLLMLAILLVVVGAIRAVLGAIFR